MCLTVDDSMDYIGVEEIVMSYIKHRQTMASAQTQLPKGRPSHDPMDIGAVGKGGTTKCNYCGMLGHTEENYWKKFPQLRRSAGSWQSPKGGPKETYSFKGKAKGKGKGNSNGNGKGKSTGKGEGKGNSGKEATKEKEWEELNKEKKNTTKNPTTRRTTSMTSQAGMRRQETTRNTPKNGTSLLTGGLRKRNGLTMTGDRARLRTTTSKLDKQDKLQLHLDYQNP